MTARPLPLVLGLALSLPAAAQNVLEGDFDGHGLTPPATDGRATDPLTLSRPGASAAGSYSAGVLFEYGNEPLARYLTDGTDFEKTVLLQHVLAANLGARIGLSERIGLGISLPFFPLTTSEVASSGGGARSFQSDGPALGDLHVRVPIGLVLPEADGSGLALSVSPYAELPTGTNGRFVADRGLGAGLVGLLGADLGPVGLTANLGGGFRGTESQENVSSGLELLGGIGGSYGLGERLAVHAEVRGAVIPGTSSEGAEGVPSALRAPVEGLLGVRGRAESGLWWGAGAGSGLTGGAGAARVRAFAGIGYSKLPEDDPASQPEAEGPIELAVTSPNGSPIPDAAVLVNGEEVARTDAAGIAELPAKTRWNKGVEVRAEGFLPQAVTEPTEGRATVALAHVPVGVPLSVRNQDGAPVTGTVTAIGPETLEPVAIGADGGVQLALEPGEWQLDIAADGYGAQSRTVIVEAGERGGEAVEVLLLESAGEAALVLDVTDRDGKPLEGVAVRIDGAPVGETGDGGRLVLRGIAEGPHDVEVISDAYQSLEKSALQLGAGETAVTFPLRRVPGSVLVLAKGPDGPATDVSVRFEGPSRLPPANLGSDGSRIFPGMRAGTWEVWAISTDYGVQRRELVVEPEDTRLLTVEFQMQAPEGGDADLRVAVVDPEGQPLEDVEVAIDGTSYGTTASGGAVEIASLAPGQRTLTLSGDRYAEAEPIPVFLVEGTQEKAVVLGWRPGTVHVRAIGPEAPVDDGQVRFAGSGTGPSGALDADGRGWFSLDGGEWAMLVTSETYGLQQRMLSIDPSSGRLTRAEVVFGPPEGGEAELALTAVDPEGEPVPGAAIRLDGVPLGATSSGGTATLSALTAGSRALEVAAPLFEPHTSTVRLRDGDNAHTARLAYAPGAVRIDVRAQGKPVTDATVRFAGPELMNPLAVDDSGSAWAELEPGSWHALVTSPTYGLQQKSIALDGKKAGPHVLAFELEPADETAELVVRVVDPDGHPVAGATVAVGETTVDAPAGGVALLTGLAPGATSLAVSAPNFQAAKLPATTLVAGPQERIVTLAWVPTKVTATITDAEGKPLAATLSFDGPGEVADVPVGASGSATFDLRPGTWQVLASAAEYGTKATELVLEPGAKSAAIELALGEAQVRTTDTEVELLGKVQFDLGKATLRPESDAILSEVAATLLANKRVVRVEVQGHTDPTGGNVINLALSQDRAEAVVADLVRRGVAPERLVARGYGSTRPVADNASEEGRALNRRVQFEMLEESE